MASDDLKDPLAIYEDKPVEDADNPEWTEEDYKRAKPMPEEILNVFPKMRGRPRKPPEEKKIQISIKLHPMVIDHFRARGPGWQTRMEQVLIDAAVEETTREKLHVQAMERPRQKRQKPGISDRELGLRMLKAIGPKAKKRSAPKKVATKPKRVPARRLKA